MKDALVICALFNIIDRMADALDVAIPSSVGFARTAERLLEQGYLEACTVYLAHPFRNEAKKPRF
jgi:hypothetical protein